jgi:acyl dehydratase
MNRLFDDPNGAFVVLFGIRFHEPVHHPDCQRVPSWKDEGNAIKN